MTEAVNAGIDTIVVDFSVNLGYFANIENVTLQGNNTVSAIGNNLDNVIIGNDGNNYISGGAAGNNTLTGGAGSDSFAFNFSAASFDVITDFVNGIDHLFTGDYLVPFVSGAGMTSGDGTNQIIYDTNTGYLYYENGLNADAAVHVATLLGIPTLSESDFYHNPPPV